MIIDQDAYGKQHDCVDMNVVIQIVQDEIMTKENLPQTKEQIINAQSEDYHF